MTDRPTLTIELTPEQYVQVAAATGLLVGALEFDVEALVERVAPRVHIPRLAIGAAEVRSPDD